MPWVRDLTRIEFPEGARARGDGTIADIRVFVLDDHELIRRGLRDAMDVTEGIEFAGDASDADEALEKIGRVRPDVAILDVRLPSRDGVEVCREIRSLYPEVRCLMLSSFAGDEVVVGAIMAGASAYYLKGASTVGLLEAVRKVAEGESLLDPSLIDMVLRKLREEPTEVQAELTEQEEKVLDLVAEGLTNRQIAERLFLAEQTVKNYVSNILAKLRVDRRIQAARFSRRFKREEAAPDA